MTKIKNSFFFDEDTLQTFKTIVPARTRSSVLNTLMGEYVLLRNAKLIEAAIGIESDPEYASVTDFVIKSSLESTKFIPAYEER